jgi:uncharacterized RDD family membrane protein YckC
VKKPEQYALEYAGFWLRLGATLIDLIILLLIYFIISRIFAVSIQYIFQSPISILISSSIAWLIKIVYVISFWVWKGQTPGKMLFGIKVIYTDNNLPFEWPHAFLRYLGYIVCTLTIFLGFIWIVFDSHKQGLHDKIADTYVVKLPVRQVVFSKNLAHSRVG